MNLLTCYTAVGTGFAGVLLAAVETVHATSVPKVLPVGSIPACLPPVNSYMLNRQWMHEHTPSPGHCLGDSSTDSSLPAVLLLTAGCLSACRIQS